jgi:UDP-N-acetylglucosamine diphosphorylase / glucose-1-phosphate thymidylyltransferase / UDP-N-acetylgalactosamine diphosphorylase / glucosamine-1-phosphate N-acetyltransferase / galactosamine-1-phosphate N-acetyltransferase
MYNVVIPMAGLGSRFPSHQFPMPKPLIPVNGKPMITRAIESFGFDQLSLQCNWYFVVAKNNFTNQLKDAIFLSVPGANFIDIDYITEGPACSALLFKDKINNDNELIIANCDQIMEWDSYMFFLNARAFQGCVVTYHTDTDKNSFARIDEKGYVKEIREKQVLSNVSLNGIHFWKQGRYFVESAEAMIEAQDRSPNGEFYIGPTYNYMIKDGKKVGIYHIPNQQHHAVGVPHDLEAYLNYVKRKTK